MEATGHETTDEGGGVSIDTDGGVLGALDLEGDHLRAVVCPECRLVRFWAL